MGSIAAIAGLSTWIVLAQQIAVARSNGLMIRPVETLWSGTMPNARVSSTVENYATHADQALQIAIYRGLRPVTQPLPILVYVHGGGWGAGTIHDRAADMRWFADQGYLVMSVGYTLSSAHVHTWNIAETQVACALAWIAANADRYGADGRQVALFGESAGGNLVVNVSYKLAADRLKLSCPGRLPRIAAVIAPYPVLDAVRMYHNTDLIAGRFAPVMTENYTGGTPRRYPERYAMITSTNHIVSTAPATLLFPALADHLLPSTSAFVFANRARAVGISIRLIAMPGAEHSFDQSSGSIGNQIVRAGTLQFLRHHRFGPPQTIDAKL